MFEGQFEIQGKVWQLRANGYTYGMIIDHVPQITSNHSISICLKRTSLGLPWYPGFKGGQDPYLCQQDENELASYLKQCSDDNQCLRTFEVLDACRYLKSSRNQLAIQMLIKINCRDIAGSIPNDSDEPSRSWLNNFVNRHKFTIKRSIEIDRNRFSAGYFNNLINFLMTYMAKISQIPAELCFNCDETMISSKRLFKAVTSKERAISHEDVPFQHLTAMVTVNPLGIRIPLFVILSGLQNLPSYLHQLKAHCWFAASANGWMTKQLFLAWTINFVHWLTFYRETLDKSMKNSYALLILDGHSSRICPSAAKYLHDHGIICIVLPAHTTHILQPFDVGVATSLKSNFKKYLLKFGNTMNSENFSNKTEKLRYCTICAFIEAFQRSSTFGNCKSAFERSCLHPIDIDRLKGNPFVVEGSAPINPQERGGYRIGGKEITSPEVIAEMCHYIQSRDVTNDLSIIEIDPVYFQNLLMEERNLVKGKMLTVFHPKIIATADGKHEILEF